MNRDQALTATLDELRDARAEMDGWKWTAMGVRLQIVHPDPTATYTYTESVPCAPYRWLKDGVVRDTNPYPPTLDGADSAMPEGWWWSRYETGAEGVKWCAGPRNGFASVYVYDTGNKIADLYRLAVLCCLAGKETGK